MADASYIIDVAAEFKGEQTLAQMDALTSKLSAAGANADSFQNAVVQVSKALDAASTASAAANVALSAGNKEYALLEQAANQAAKAQEKAAKLGVVPPEVASSLRAANAALQGHTAELTKLEQAAKTAAADEDKLSLSLSNVKKLSAATATAQKDAASVAKDAARETGVLRRSFSELGGPLGSLGHSIEGPIQAFQKLSGVMGSGQAAAVVAAAGAATVAAAIAVATAVAIAATIAIAAWAVGLADANRTAGLTTEAVEIMNPKLEALHDTIDGLTDQTGLGENALDGIAQSLIDAKVAAADLPEALKAAALEERALGTGGAAKFIADMKTSKKSVAALAAETQDKLGGVVAKQMLGLTAQTGTLKTNIGRIFGDLDIDPVLSGFHKLVALFDDNTAAGQAMKFLFTSVFQPLINQADNAATVIEGFVLGFLIGLTKVYIAVKPVTAAVAGFLGFKDASLTNTLALVTKAGEYIAPVFVVAVAAFAAFAVVAGVVVAAVLAVGAAFVAPLYAVAALAVAIQVALVAAVAYIASFLSSLDIVGGIRNAWAAVTNFFDGISLADVGLAIIEGLATGIVGAGPAVLKALGSVVTGAITSAKNLLGIHSPSKVFAEIGGYTAEGFASGVDDGADQAQTSLAKLVEPPQAKMSASGGGGSTGKSSGGAGQGGASINGNTFILNGVKDAPDAESRIRELLTRMLEGDAIQASGGEALEPT